MHNNSWLTTLPFDVDNTACHVPPSQRSDISSKQLKYYQDDYLVFPHYASFTQMLSKSYIYMLLTNFTTIFLIPWQLRIFQNIHHHQHGNCRILADGMRIWHLECHYHLTSVLGRRPWPDHPRHSLRTCLHHLPLDTHQSHTMSAVWRSFIWMFCSCNKCSIYPAVVFSRWRLWEWFQQWLTNTFMKKTTHTPHFWHGACILWSSPHYAMPPSWHATLWHTTNLAQTSVPLPNIYFWQFREWPGSRQLIRQWPGSRQVIWWLIRWRRRFPNSTYGWWTLDNRNGTRKNILYTWKWVTQQCVNTHALMGIIIILSHIWTA